jgi:hypothetical protein
MGLLRRKPSDEAAAAQAALEQARVQLTEAGVLAELEDDGREATGQPSPGAVQPATDAYEDALTIERDPLPSEDYRRLKAQIAHLEAKLERKQERLKHAGDEARPGALRGIELLESEIDALNEKLWELDDARIPDQHVCPRCGTELADVHRKQIHRLDCRAPRFDY